MNVRASSITTLAPPAEVVMHSVGVAQEVVHCKN
jgi:hypothetical protein